MICLPCRERNHPACASVDCTCGHQGSVVRPLTGRERHDRVMGRHDDIVRPLGAPEAREVITIRTSALNGNPEETR